MSSQRWNVVPVEWMDRIGDVKLMPLVARNFLSDAINMGGYVTGGFARSLACSLLEELRMLPSAYGGWMRTAEYLGNPGWRQRQDLDRHRLWKAGMGDVDIFFPTQLAAVNATDAAVSRLPPVSGHDVVWHHPTLARFGHEFLVGGVIFQIIEKISGHPHDVLSGFDISNAKVYLDHSGLHFTDEWLRLEETCRLGVDRFEKPNVLWRVRKWFNRHGYSDLRAGDHDKWVDAVFRMVNLAKRGEIVMWGNPIEVRSIKAHGKWMMSLLPPSDLLKLSMLYDGYDMLHVMKTLSDNVERSRK